MSKQKMGENWKIMETILIWVLSAEWKCLYNFKAFSCFCDLFYDNKDQEKDFISNSEATQSIVYYPKPNY